MHIGLETIQVGKPEAHFETREHRPGILCDLVESVGTRQQGRGEGRRSDSVTATNATRGARVSPRSKWRDSGRNNTRHPAALSAGSTCGLVWPHVLDMDIGAEPDVVGQVPAVVVGIFVNHDIVAIPEPIAAIAEVEGGYAETKTAEPEAVRASAAKMPHMAAAEAAGEVSVLKGMIEMIVNVAAAGVVANPLAVVMDVGSVGMPRFVVEMRGRLRRMRRARRSGTVLGNVGSPATNTVNRSVLSKRRERK